MTELDAALVRKKLSAIRENLSYLEEVAGLSLSEYRADRFRRKGAERMLQEVIEAAVDVNQHLLAERKQNVASDYRESFLAAGRAGVIPESLAEQLAPSAGLRNRLVHEYDEIDDAIVLSAFRVAIYQYGQYIAIVERYLSGKGL